MAITDGSVKVPNPVMRNKVADYLKVGETFELMGVGFETLDENPNAQSMQKTYVNQATASSFITSYQTEFSYSADMIASEKAIMALYECGRITSPVPMRSLNTFELIFFPRLMAPPILSRRGNSWFPTRYPATPATAAIL